MMSDLKTKSGHIRWVELFMAFQMSMIGCTKKNSVTSAPILRPDFSKLTSNCFQPDESNPVLTRGSLLAGADWNDPSVIKQADQLVMYASSDQNFNFNISIYRLVSADGTSWTLNPINPVLQPPTDNSAWDHRAVETPSVVFFNNKYHMFYTGYPITHTDSYSYKIGHAQSANGITWERSPSPVIGPNDPYNSIPNLTFDQWIVAEPAAVVFNNMIYLYFSAVGANAALGTTLQVIGLITSSDGVTWSAPQSVLEPEQTFYPRTTWLGYSTPFALVLNDQLHLFFDVIQSSPWKQLKIHHAYSHNGISDWVHDESATLQNSQFSWTSNELRAPSLLMDGVNLLMWFAGDDGSTLGIGHAKCSL